MAITPYQQIPGATITNSAPGGGGLAQQTGVPANILASQAAFKPSSDPNYNAAAGADVLPGYKAPTPAASAAGVGQDLSSGTAALLKAIAAETAANAPGTAPTLDLNAIQSQASQAANNAVNPLYTNYLNQYLQGEAANQQAAQQQNTLNLSGEQNALSDTLAKNTLAQNQAGATNALTQGNINASQQNYELQSGNAQNAKLQAIQANIGSGNLGGSGLGQQQIYNAENTRNAADAAQRGQFQYQRDTSNLSTQDTFAQLAQSSQQASTGEGLQEAQTNFNLNDYLRQAAQHDQAAEAQLEASRQQALTSAQQNSEAQLIQQQLNGLNLNSKDTIAANQRYQPYLQTTAAPSFDLTSLLNGVPNYGSGV